MDQNPREWLRNGEGRSPNHSWTVSTEAPLVAMRLARESGEVIAADASGGLYLINRQGQLAHLTRGKKLTSLAWADTGECGAALLDGTQLHWLDRKLAFQGKVELPGPGLAIAVEPHGRYVAVSLDGGITAIYDSNRKFVRKWTTLQSLVSIEFLPDQPVLVGVAEYGLLCAFRFTGEKVFQQSLYGNVGEMAICPETRHILLACFVLGVQCHDMTGGQVGSYQVGGTASRITSSYMNRRLAVATLENHFYWIDQSGQIVWAGILPDEICRMECDPLGSGLVIGFKSGTLQRLDW